MHIVISPGLGFGDGLELSAHSNLPRTLDFEMVLSSVHIVISRGLGLGDGLELSAHNNLPRTWTWRWY